MSVMAGGCETTEEDRFVYSGEVQAAITELLVGLDKPGRVYSLRSLLEDFAWKVVRIREDAR
jgi:hypothetical protein